MSQMRNAPEHANGGQARQVVLVYGPSAFPFDLKPDIAHWRDYTVGGCQSHGKL